MQNSTEQIPQRSAIVEIDEIESEFAEFKRKLASHCNITHISHLIKSKYSSTHTEDMPKIPNSPNSFKPYQSFNFSTKNSPQLNLGPSTDLLKSQYQQSKPLFQKFESDQVDMVKEEQPFSQSLFRKSKELRQKISIKDRRSTSQVQQTGKLNHSSNYENNQDTAVEFRKRANTMLIPHISGKSGIQNFESTMIGHTENPQEQSKQLKIKDKQIQNLEKHINQIKGQYERKLSILYEENLQMRRSLLDLEKQKNSAQNTIFNQKKMLYNIKAQIDSQLSESYDYSSY